MLTCSSNPFKVPTISFSVRIKMWMRDPIHLSTNSVLLRVSYQEAELGWHWRPSLSLLEASLAKDEIPDYSGFFRALKH